MRGEEIRENGRRKRRGEKRRSIRTSGNAKRDLGELKLGPLLRSTHKEGRKKTGSKTFELVESLRKEGRKEKRVLKNRVNIIQIYTTIILRRFKDIFSVNMDFLIRRYI